MVALLNALDVLAVGTSLLGAAGDEYAPDVVNYTSMTPWKRLAAANERGMWHGMDPPLRELAAFVSSDASDVRTEGAAEVARWIRSRMVYAQEAPGVELLQGPYDSLRYKTTDCDDAGILFLSLTRAIGLTTYMAGIAMQEDIYTLIHAVGWQGALDLEDEDGFSPGIYYELINDSRYGGTRSGLQFLLPAGYAGVIYTPEPDIKGYWQDDGQGFYKVEGEPR